MMSLISQFVAWKWIIRRNIFFKCSYLCLRDTGSLSSRIILSSLWHNSHHPLQWMLKYLGSVWCVWAEGWRNSSQLWLWSSPAWPPTSWKTPSLRRPESEEEKSTKQTVIKQTVAAKTSTSPFVLTLWKLHLVEIRVRETSAYSC